MNDKLARVRLAARRSCVPRAGSGSSLLSVGSDVLQDKKGVQVQDHTVVAEQVAIVPELFDVAFFGFCIIEKFLLEFRPLVLKEGFDDRLGACVLLRCLGQPWCVPGEPLG